MSNAVTGRIEDFGPQDYDAIERAVMETPRGRWFLSERDKRRLTDETQRILDALKKLERAVASAPPPAAPVNGTDVLKAIAAQRAVQERHAPVDATKHAVVAELTSASAETFAQSLSMKNMKYFKQDEAVFTPAEPVQPKLSVVEAETPAQKSKTMVPPKPEDAVVKGARLIVNRIASVAGQPAAAAATPDSPPAPAGHAVPIDTPLAESADKRRIVIIRRTSAETVEAPFQADPSANASP